MKIKVSELTGAALDWAVALALGAKAVKTPEAQSWHLHWPSPLFGDEPKWSVGAQDYSTNWSQGGPLIERENICLISSTGHPLQATIYKGGHVWVDQFGPTPLVAAMRCFVASELGDEVDVPEELT